MIHRWTPGLTAIACCLTTLFFVAVKAAAQPGAGKAPALPGVTGNDPAVARSFGQVPLYFVRNDGQLDPAVRYYERGRGHALYFAPDGVTLKLGGKAGGAAGARLKLGVRGASPDPALVAEEPQATRVNHFVGRDPSRWVSGAPTYGAVRYQGVYRGVDLRFYGNNRELEYDVILQPGASPEDVVLAYQGAESLSVGGGGELVVAVADGRVVQRRPYAYQEVDGTRREVAARFELLGDGAFGFAVGEYDPARPLVIDPVVEFASYWGNAWANDSVAAIALDPDGNIVFGGVAWPGEFSGQDAIVVKMNNAGDTVLYETWLGGSRDESVTGLAVDNQGAVYVTGAASQDFPTTSGALHETVGFGGLPFVAKLSPTDGTPIYSTFLSDVSATTRGIAVNDVGEAYVVGTTTMAGYPTTQGAFQTVHGGAGDGFVTVLNGAGSGLVYSTFLGGAGADTIGGIALVGGVTAVVAGQTNSDDFPVQNAFQATKGAGTGLAAYDAFVTKIAPGGASLTFSTYFGGSAYDVATAVSVDPDGNIYFTGSTESLPSTFPLLLQIQATRGYMEAFVAKLDPTGDLLFNTYLGGGTSADRGFGVAAGANGAVAVVGQTSSTDFNTLDPFQAAIGSTGGVPDGFVAKIDTTITNTTVPTLLYSSYFGGNGEDSLAGVAMDAAGVVYAGGYSYSDDLAVVSPYQGALAGYGDGILLKVSGGAPAVAGTAPASGATGVPLTDPIAATFVEAIDPDSLTASFTVAVTGGAVVAGSVSYDAATWTATFTPDAPLAPSTSYTASVTTGATSTAGIPLAADHVWSFTTEAPTPPSVVSTDPVDGAPAVATNTLVTATFDEAMDPDSLTANFTVAVASGAAVAGSVSYDGGSFTATFTPDVDLEPSTLYEATVATGATDAVGNGLEADYTWTFTTAAAPDTTAPTVRSVSPLDGATAVPTGATVTARFDEAMDPGSLTASFTVAVAVGTAVTGSVSYDAGTLTATFAPSAALTTDTEYRATITTAATDAAGNGLEAEHTWTFTTAPAPDTTPPSVTVTAPVNGATDVPLGSTVSATFDEAMAEATFRFNFTVRDGGGSAIAGSIDYDAGSRTVTFTPTAELAPEAHYSATLTSDVTDTAGNGLAELYLWSFTTGAAPDTTPPTVQSTTPADTATDVALNAAVTATFDEAMGEGTLTPATFTVEGAAGAVAGNLAYDAGTRTATFLPSGDLSPEATYTATVTTGATDAAGNGLAADHVWTFTTGAAPDTTPPTVQSTTPADAATYVALNTAVTATFDEAMDAATLTPSSFTIAGPAGTVSGVVSYDGESRTATFVPAAALGWETTYTATMTTGAADIAGNGLGADHSWSFTTISEDYDSDGDGVPDNQDLQPEAPSIATPQAVTGTGVISITTEAYTGSVLPPPLAQVQTLSPSDPTLNQTGRPSDAIFPHGLVSFTVEGSLGPDNAIRVTIAFPDDLPPGTVYYKVDSGGFHPYPWASIVGNAVYLDLYDNGQNGDLVAGDGVIQDPGGIAVPTPDSDDDNPWWQGGCFLQTVLH